MSDSRRQYNRILLLAIFNQSFHWFIIGLIIPVLTLLQMEKGLSLLQVGITSAVWAASILLLELPTGGLADAAGRKKTYLLSLIVTFIGSLVFLFSPGFSAVLAGVFVLGLGRALSSGAMEAYFVERFIEFKEVKNLQESLAKVNTFVPAGLALGSLLGGFLPQFFEHVELWHGITGIYGWNLVFMACAALLQFLFTAVLVREDKSGRIGAQLAAGFRQVPDVLKTSIAIGFKNKVILLLLFGSLVWGFSFSGLEGFWQPQVDGFPGTAGRYWVFGVLSAGYFLAAGVGSLLSTAVCKIFGDRYARVLAIMRICTGALFILLSLQNGLLGFALVYFVLFMFNGIATSPDSALINGQIPESSRSTLLSLQSLFMQAGGMFGSVIHGTAAQTVSISFAWIIGGALFGVSAVLFFMIEPRS
jgi:MFS transporter, DHA1 family, quinolone resistance protein